MVDRMDDLSKIANFYDDPDKKGPKVSPGQVPRRGSAIVVSASSPIHLPAVVPPSSPNRKGKTGKDTDSFVSRSMPEIAEYKTRLPGWSSAESSPVDKARSPEGGRSLLADGPQLGPQAKSSILFESAAQAGAENAEEAGGKEEGKGKGKGKGPPPGEPKPKLTRAERRALQEKQRAAKAAAGKGKQSNNKPKETPKESAKGQDDDARKEKEDAKKGKPAAAAAPSAAPVEHFRNNPTLFAHLPPHTSMQPPDELEKKRRKCIGIHPAVLRLGLQYEHYQITGANRRTQALIQALKEVICDYEVPAGEQIRYDLTRHINQQISYLVTRRPLATSMGNFIKHLKQTVFKLEHNIKLEDAVALLLDELELYELEKITHPRKTIVKFGASCVKDGDVILVYGDSEVVRDVLLSAHASEKHIEVVVVDSRPLFHGSETAKAISDAGIPVTYVQLHSLCYIIKDVSKTFLGASALQSNGSVYSYAGTAMVATVSKTFKVPVIVFCESYKFVESAKLDAIVTNEIGAPDALLADKLAHPHKPLNEWRDVPNLKLLNLVYDLTPIECVKMVVTDVGMIPPTSVPVVLREYQEGKRDGQGPPTL